MRPDTEEYQYVPRMKLKSPSRVQNKDDARKVKLLMRLCREIRMCNGHELTSLDLSVTLRQKNCTEHRRRLWNGYGLISLDISVTLGQKDCTEQG